MYTVDPLQFALVLLLLSLKACNEERQRERDREGHEIDPLWLLHTMFACLETLFTGIGSYILNQRMHSWRGVRACPESLVISYESSPISFNDLFLSDFCCLAPFMCNPPCDDQRYPFIILFLPQNLNVYFSKMSISIFPLHSHNLLISFEKLKTPLIRVLLLQLINSLVYLTFAPMTHVNWIKHSIYE